MQTQNAIAHSLYALYETLSNDIQQQFLQELLQKQAEKLEMLALYMACNEAKDENDFLTESETLNFINNK